MTDDLTQLRAELRERAASYRLGGPSSEHTAALLDRAADALDALQAERDEARAHIRKQAEDIMTLGALVYAPGNPPVEWKARAEAAEARVTALEKGLEPFACECEACERVAEDRDDKCHFRALLNPKEGSAE